ncbi:Band 4.1-like protein 4A [Hypsibius exemplaris]|uniref:Band 4.1-like protein 4A n=1 Tax=Hypsibius exemplaris TaxID=2072580 RepID=A0A1W0WVB9_HYPEX|nr:Band 4.1-like protein 4A [Hypsibius exemplaris]
MFWFPLRDRLVCLKVILLDHRELEYDCKASVKGKEFLDFVLDSLRLLEREYFGLRYMDDVGQVQWLDTTKSLRKQLNKCMEPYVFYFSVKFYASAPELLLEERTRYQFFLQLKRDILHQNLSAPDEALADLGAFALQSEIGSYEPARHEPGYASEFTRSNFAPDPAHGRLVKAIEMKHQTLRGQKQADAECAFLARARRLDLYGVDMHPVQSDGSGDADSFLGLSPFGVLLIQNDQIMGMYAWPIITKIDKDVQWPLLSSLSSALRTASVMIHVRGKDGINYSYGFRLATKEACRHLWRTAREHCDFQRKLRGERARPSSISSRISRFSSRFRSSSRADSETTSGETSVDRRAHRSEPVFRRAKSTEVPSRQSLTKSASARQRLHSASVIQEDETRSMMRPEFDSAGRRVYHSEMLVDTTMDEITELRPAPAVGRGRNVPPSSRRSESPMSMQSSFSTCPRRYPPYPAQSVIMEQDNDNDSVFSDSSRMSHVTGHDINRKRKVSTVGQSNSSGGSEEAGHVAVGTSQRASTTLRTSLVPARRRKMGRNQTHDGIAIQQALAQLSQPQSPSQYASLGRDMSLPDRLAAIMQPMQPVKSQTMVSGGRPRPPLSLNPNLGKSMNQLSYVAPLSPSIKDVQVAMDGFPLFSVNPADTLYLNSNTLNPPITPSAKLKGFEKFSFGGGSSALQPRSPSTRDSPMTMMPVSASWTAGENSVEFSLQRTPPPPSATKSRSFDFQLDAPQPPRTAPTEGAPQPPRPAPTEGAPQPPRTAPTEGAPQPPRPVPTEGAPQPPRPVPTEVPLARPIHVRSISSSDATKQNPSAPRMPMRSRLRSDGCFQSTSREHDYEDADRYTRTPSNDVDRHAVNSPMLSPFPIIPPPTPFTEETISSPPAIPARNLITCKSTAKRLGLGGGPPARNDSFTAALKSSDIEMQSLKSDVVVFPERRPSAEEASPLFDSVPVPQTSHVVVEADVHVSNGYDHRRSSEQVYDALPMGNPKLSNGRSKTSLLGCGQPLLPSTASNQMYFEMNGHDSGKDSQTSGGGQSWRKAGYPVTPVHPVQLPSVLSTNCPSSISHPLAMVHSKRRESSEKKNAWLSPSGSAGTSSSNSSASPTDENDPTSFGSPQDSHSSLKKLQAIYSNDNGYAMYTDI